MTTILILSTIIAILLAACLWLLFEVEKLNKWLTIARDERALAMAASNEINDKYQRLRASMRIANTGYVLTHTRDNEYRMVQVKKIGRPKGSKNKPKPIDKQAKV